MAGYVRNVRNLRDGELQISDGGANSITLVLDEGNLSFEETRNVINVLDRGVLDHRRAGDEAPISVSFSLKYEYLLADTGDTAEAISVREALTQSGAASSWASTDSTGRPFSTRLTFWVKNPDTAGKDEKIVFEKFHPTSIRVAEGDPTMIEVTGEDFETIPTITREDYT